MSQSIDTNTASPKKQELEALRLRDHFYFYSIPGILKLESSEREQPADAILLSQSTRTFERKTRVSCESSSFYDFEEILKEVDAMEEEESPKDTAVKEVNNGRNGFDYSNHVIEKTDLDRLECNLDALRVGDPFYHYSVPGALKLEFDDDEDAAHAFLLSAMKRTFVRKTRVSCECSSLDIFADMLEDDGEWEEDAPNVETAKEEKDDIQQEIQNIVDDACAKTPQKAMHRCSNTQGNNRHIPKTIYIPRRNPPAA